MPLTEQEVNDFKTVLEKGGELPAHLKPLMDLGIVVRTPAMEEAFKNHFKTTEINTEIKKTHDLYDKDVFDLTGIKKDPSEKSYEYMKRALPQHVSGLKTELEDLKKKKGDGNATEAEKQRIAQLEGLLADKDKTYGEEITKLKSSLELKDVENALSSGLIEIKGKLKKALGDSVLKEIIETRLNRVKASAKFMEIEGKKQLVFMDENNQPRISKSTYKALTAEEVLADVFKDVMEEERKQEGAGTGGAGAAGGAGGKVDHTKLVPPQEVKTKVELMDWLKKQGLTTGSKEFNEVYNKYEKDLKLR